MEVDDELHTDDVADAGQPQARLTAAYNEKRPAWFGGEIGWSPIGLRLGQGHADVKAHICQSLSEVGQSRSKPATAAAQASTGVLPLPLLILATMGVVQDYLESRTKHRSDKKCWRAVGQRFALEAWSLRSIVAFKYRHCGRKDAVQTAHWVHCS